MVLYNYQLALIDEVTIMMHITLTMLMRVAMVIVLASGSGSKCKHFSARANDSAYSKDHHTTRTLFVLDGTTHVCDHRNIEHTHAHTTTNNNNNNMD